MPDDHKWLYELKKWVACAKSLNIPMILMPAEDPAADGLSKLAAKISYISENLAHDSRLISAFTTSPHVKLLSKRSHVKWHWLPMGADLKEWGSLMKNGFEQKYDLGFEGECKASGEAGDFPVCLQFGRLATAFKLTPNLLPAECGGPNARTPTKQKECSGDYGYDYSGSKKTQKLSYKLGDHALKKLITETKVWVGSVGMSKQYVSRLPAKWGVREYFPSGIDVLPATYFKVRHSH
jgi:hypothetical protein